MNKETPASFRLLRYGDLTLTVLVGVLIVSLFWNQLSSITVPFTDQASQWPVLAQVVLYGMIIASLWLVIKRLRGVSREHIFSKRLFQYPPTWLGGLVGYLFFVLLVLPWLHNIKKPEENNLIFKTSKNSSSQLETVTGQLQFSISKPAIKIDDAPAALEILVASLFFIAFGMAIASTRKDEKSFVKKSKQKKKRLLDDMESIREWIKEENPIKAPEDDLFGHAVYAERIALLLSKEEDQTIALIGAYGKGKSGVLNMVETILERNEADKSVSQSLHGRAVIITRADIWGLPPTKIPFALLRSALVEVSQKVDCLPFYKMPRDYFEQMQKEAPSLLAMLVKILFRARSIADTFKSFAGMLKAVDVRLIIFIEDIERNQDASVAFESIAAFLERIGKLENISFVFAIAPSKQIESSSLHVTLPRICKYIEAMP